MPFLRMWVHCPRASNGLSPRRSNLVGYVRWDAQSDQFPPCQTIIPTAFRSQSALPTICPEVIHIKSEQMPDNEVLAAIWSACMCLENQRDVCWSARANDFPTFLVVMSFSGVPGRNSNRLDVIVTYLAWKAGVRI